MSKKKWLYGKSWEKSPIEEGEVWGVSESMIQVLNWMQNEIPEFMTNGEMVYCDPPWNLGNVNSFYTKAEETRYENSFVSFYRRLFENIVKVSPFVCYLEIGKQNVNNFESELNKIFPVVQKWEITYYKKNPCYLLRGGNSIIDYDFTGLDDENIPFVAIKKEVNINSVVDFCTGRGLTMISALKAGKTFFGTELNKRRLAVGIEKAKEIGVVYEKK